MKHHFHIMPLLLVSIAYTVSAMEKKEDNLKELVERSTCIATYGNVQKGITLQLRKQTLTSLQNIIPLLNNIGSNLKVIDISHNKYSMLPLNAIVQQCPNLYEINASHGTIESIEYPQSDWYQNTIQKLDISHNKIELLRLGCLIHFVSKYNKGFREVDASNNPIAVCYWQEQVINDHWDNNERPILQLVNTQLTGIQKQAIIDRYYTKSENTILGCPNISLGSAATVGTIAFCTSLPGIMFASEPLGAATAVILALIGAPSITAALSSATYFGVKKIQKLCLKQKLEEARLEAQRNVIFDTIQNTTVGLGSSDFDSSDSF